ncbi:tetratricopeptide repeat protein [Hyphomicrobium sp.]|uniref:tetratricopeptide repeat protein n=1 Tax=Hyphomicrobium sp. TaxID=82 RepID=UPI0025BD5D67|nr:tetratricopeptide repeat protein [Hyphomicrobium sp.]MCC7251931.1 tetratricopeptide repeat protein [Hyphomicrobium sp.]
MKSTVIAFCASLLLATTAGAGPLEDCNSNDKERQVTGCTAALKTMKFNKKNKAVLFSRRGDAYLQLGQHEAALDDFNACVELKPDDENCLLGKADAYLSRGDVDQAIKTFKTLIAFYDKQSDGDLAAALVITEACETLVERADERFQKAAGTVTEFALTGDADRPGIESAIKDLTECLDFDPGDPEALGKRALYQHFLGRKKEAVADAEASHKEEPKNAQALAVLAITSLADKDYTRSLEFSQKWLDSAGGNINAERQLIKALEAAGRKDEAAALARLSENRESCNVAMETVLKGQHAKADDGIAVCTAVIEGAGGRGLTAPHEFRGYMRGLKGDYEGSIADYTRAIEISGATGGLANFYTRRGEKYAALKKHELAIADFEATLKQLPDNIDALYGSATSKLELGRFEEAKAGYERLKQVIPNDASPFAGLGEVAKKTGKHEDAVTNYSKALELRPGLALVHQARGLSLEKLGRKEQAIADFRKALTLDANLAESTEALKRLGANP